MPDPNVYKGLAPYLESAKPLLEKYPTNEFNPEKGAALLAELGWKKGSDGLYQDPDGKPFTLEIISFFDFPSVGPVLAELLVRQGMNATYGQPPDMFDRFFAGDFNAAIFGHGGSVKDPYETLRLYQSSASHTSWRRGSTSGQPRALEQQGVRHDRRRSIPRRRRPTPPRCRSCG